MEWATTVSNVVVVRQVGRDQGCLRGRRTHARQRSAGGAAWPLVR
jgi:hypothetical protein